MTLLATVVGDAGNTVDGTWVGGPDALADGSDATYLTPDGLGPNPDTGEWILSFPAADLPVGSPMTVRVRVRATLADDPGGVITCAFYRDIDGDPEHGEFDTDLPALNVWPTVDPATAATGGAPYSTTFVDRQVTVATTSLISSAAADGTLRIYLDVVNAVLTELSLASGMLRAVSAAGDVYRVTADLPNPDGGVLRLVQADGTVWKQTATGSPLRIVGAGGEIMELTMGQVETDFYQTGLENPTEDFGSQVSRFGTNPLALEDDEVSPGERRVMRFDVDSGVSVAGQFHISAAHGFHTDDIADGFEWDGTFRVRVVLSGGNGVPLSVWFVSADDTVTTDAIVFDTSGHAGTDPWYDLTHTCTGDGIPPSAMWADGFAVYFSVPDGVTGEALDIDFIQFSADGVWP